MWIFDQTQTQLFNTDTIAGICMKKKDSEHFMLILNSQKESCILGVYSSMKRCQKIIEDLMQNLEDECMTVDLFSQASMNTVPYVRLRKTIFRMPEE